MDLLVVDAPNVNEKKNPFLRCNRKVGYIIYTIFEKILLLHKFIILFVHIRTYNDNTYVKIKLFAILSWTWFGCCVQHMQGHIEWYEHFECGFFFSLTSCFAVFVIEYMLAHVYTVRVFVFANHKHMVLGSSVQYLFSLSLSRPNTIFNPPPYNF